MIATLFPHWVVTVEATVEMCEEMWSGTLHPEERACVVGAVPKRRREFTAGRLCARRGLAQLGIDGFPLLPREDRTPRWPSGTAGSISHCEGYCGVAVVRVGEVISLGFDAEESDPLEEGLRSLVCTEREMAHIGSLLRRGAPDWAKLIFSAKESTYKCYYPLTGTSLEFHDVEVELEPKAGSFTARIVREGVTAGGGVHALAGRFAYDANRVYTGVTLRNPGRF